MRLNRYKKLLKNHFENGFSFYFILFLILVLGVIIGSLIIKLIDESTRNFILSYSNSYYYVLFKSPSGSIEVFKHSLWFNLFFIIVLYFVGIFNLGFIIPGIIFIKGGLWGFLVGYLIENYGIKGFLVSIFALYPQFIVYIPCVVTLGALAMTMTFKYKFSAKRKVIKIKRLEILEYTIFVLFFSSAMLIGIIYEGFVSPIFLNLIDLVI